MDKKARGLPFFLPALFAIIVLALLGYLLFSDMESSRTEHTVAPPIELEEPELELVPSLPMSPSQDQQALMEEEAEAFVENLAPESEQDEPVTVTEEEGEFVRYDGEITIPTLEHRDTTISELQQDETLSEDMPVTIEYTETSREATTLKQLSESVEDKTALVELETAEGEKITAPLADILNVLARQSDQSEQPDMASTPASTSTNLNSNQANSATASQSDNAAPSADDIALSNELAQVTAGSETPQLRANKRIDKTQATVSATNNESTQQNTMPSTPLAERLSQLNIQPDTPLTLLKEEHHVEQTTIGKLAELAIPADKPVSVTVQTGSETFAVKEIIKDEKLTDNALFYLHRVTERDVQGLWGIIQTGLIQRFRQGLNIEGIAQNKNMVKIIIPADADEPLPDGLSSFLGKVLDHKVTSSYIYNYSTDTMGHDPNLIYPGQQLILIHFDQTELKQIYTYFAEQRNQDAQSYAIPY